MNRITNNFEQFKKYLDKLIKMNAKFQGLDALDFVNTKLCNHLVTVFVEKELNVTNENLAEYLDTTEFNIKSIEYGITTLWVTTVHIFNDKEFVLHKISYEDLFEYNNNIRVKTELYEALQKSLNSNTIEKSKKVKV